MKMQKKKKKEKTEKKNKKRRRHRSASRVLCPTNKKLVLPLPFPLEGGGWGGHKQAKKSPNQAQKKKCTALPPVKRCQRR